MAANPEPERRFLLKSRPYGPEYTNELAIFQFYTDDKVRYRSQRPLSQPQGETRYFRTVKTPLERGVNLEDETEIGQEEFESQRPLFTRFVRKTRLLVPAENGLKWEVDRFWSATLVIAEIELPVIDYPITLPDWMQSELIMEVTGLDQFSNYKLSNPYEHYDLDRVLSP